jgi:hypothetical protein
LGGPLTAGDIELVRQWITAGAVNNYSRALAARRSGRLLLEVISP